MQGLTPRSVAPFQLEITRLAQFNWQFRIPSHPGLVMGGTPAQVIWWLQHQGFPWGWTGRALNHSRSLNGPGLVLYNARDVTQARLDALAVGQSLLLNDLNTDTKHFEFIADVFWARLFKKIRSERMRGRRVPMRPEMRTVGGYMEANVIPDDFKALQSKPQDGCIVERLPQALRDLVLLECIRPFLLEDPELRKKMPSRSVRRTIVSNSTNPIHDCAVSQNPMLPIFLAVPSLKSDANRLLFGQCFFDFQPDSGIQISSYETVQQARTFFSKSETEPYAKFAQKIRLVIELETLKHQPAILTEFIESLTRVKLSTISIKIKATTDGVLHLTDQSLMIPQFNIRAAPGHEITLLIAPTVAEGTQLANASKKERRVFTKTAKVESLALLSQVLLSPHHIATQLPSTTFASSPYEVRAMICDFAVRIYPAYYSIRKPPKFTYTGDRKVVHSTYINNVHKAPVQFLVDKTMKRDLMDAYLQYATFQSSTRDSIDVIEDFFDRLGSSQCAQLRQIQVNTNLSWEGALWHDRLPAVLLAIIRNCTDDSEATEIDTDKHQVSMESYSAPVFQHGIPKYYSPNVYRDHQEPPLGSLRMRQAAHEAFFIRVQGFGSHVNVTIKVSVPYSVFPYVAYSPFRKYGDLVTTINGALRGESQDFLETAFEWKVLKPYTDVVGAETKAVDWVGMARPRLNQ